MASISHHHVKVVNLDITGASMLDSDVVAYFNKTIQAAQLKGARAIITGISENVAERIVD